MADAQLRAVITAQDNASQVIAKVGGSLDAMKSRLETATEASKKVALGLAGFVTVAGGFAAKGVQVAGQLEAMRQGFVTLLGSAEAADKTMARIKEEAARTPFELPGLTSATQALALVTKDGDKAINVLLDVGKALATAGKGQAELDRIIANLQQIALTGKITEMDIRQFGMNGINILELLAEYYGTTTEKAGDMVKESSDAFGDLTKAFQKAGSEGGKFANGFKNQAGTFNQLWSNLSDTITIALSDFVKNTGVFDAVKDAVGRLIAVLPTLINHLESGIKWLKEHKEILPIIAGMILGALTPAIYAAVAAFAGFAVALLPFVAAGGALAMLIKGIKDGNIAFTAIASGLLTLFIPTIIGLATTLWTTAIPAVAAFIVAWGPLLLAGAVVGGVVAGVLYIIRHWEELKAKAIEIWGAIVNFLTELWNKYWETVKTVWTSIFNYIVSVWQGLSDSAKGWLLLMGTIMTGGLLFIVLKVIEHWDLIKAKTIEAWEAITLFLSQVWSAIAGVITPPLAAIGSFIASTWEKIKAATIDAWNGIKDFFSDVWAAITSVFNSAIDSIMKKLQPLINAVNTVKSGASSISDSVGKGLGKAGNILNDVIGVNDAIISPNGNIITTHPDDYLIATKNPRGLGGSGITINVYGDVSGQELIDKVKRGIMNELKQNVLV